MMAPLAFSTLRNPRTRKAQEPQMHFEVDQNCLEIRCDSLAFSYRLRPPSFGTAHAGHPQRHRCLRCWKPQFSRLAGDLIDEMATSERYGRKSRGGDKLLAGAPRKPTYFGTLRCRLPSKPPYKKGLGLLESPSRKIVGASIVLVKCWKRTLGRTGFRLILCSQTGLFAAANTIRTVCEQVNHKGMASTKSQMTFTEFSKLIRVAEKYALAAQFGGIVGRDYSL